MFTAYVQEIGRSGRTGTNAMAVLYYNNNDLAIKQMRREMREYCRGEKCHRQLINDYFGFPAGENPPTCCNICQPELGLEWDFQKLSVK